ncbi:MAG: TerD family protein [Gordonia sp. (in: high G+C Gram-positive bacteria)]|uniref:TerD family protein n=1 Tax=Gordonia sp. (in: high G+C Gram-positive bacteria) TaxID=84139 RepID=UPI0039E5D01D
MTLTHAAPVVLTKGSNTLFEPILGTPEPSIAIGLHCGTVQPGVSVVADVSVLLVDATGRVRSNDDFVFYNQPSGEDGAVRLDSLGVTDAPAVVIADLAQLPESVARVVIAASLDEVTGDVGLFGMLDGAEMWVAAAAEPSQRLIVSGLTGLTEERALIVGEVYRHSSGWKIRAVGQGYRDGLAPLVSEFGIDVDDDTDGSGSTADDATADEAVADGAAENGVVEEQDGATTRLDSARKVGLTRRRKNVARLPEDWDRRPSPGLPVDPSEEPHRPARLFPTVGMKTGMEQEGRATSTLLAVMEIVPDFGKRITTALGSPRGRVETFTEVRFSHAGQEFRPDGLVRVTRGGRTWSALLEVKTGKGVLKTEQIEDYLKVARAHDFDAVVTISCDLMPTAEDVPFPLPSRMPKSVAVRHLSWEEIAVHAANERDDAQDPTDARLLDELVRYLADTQAGTWTFGDMGRNWVKVREGVANSTLAAKDPATVDVCFRFDQLIRHIALQLTTLTGETVASQIPNAQADAVSRAQQLADSGELFGTVRVPRATSPVVVNANLARKRISCSQRVGTPRTARPVTKVNWLLRQLKEASPKLRLTAHHLGSRTEVSSALLGDVREDPTLLVPPGDKDIREFTVTGETSMGAKRSSSENGFVAAMVNLVNGFYREVTQELKVSPRE